MKIKLLLLYRNIIMYSFYGLVTQLLLCSLVLATEVTVAQKNMSVKKTNVTLNFSSDDLVSVFDEIEEKTNFTFVYTKKELDKKIKFDGNYKDVPLFDVLLDISKKSNLAFRQFNKNITVKNIDLTQNLKSLVEVLADVDISGKITDENGQGLPGASVVEKGTTNGATSDLDGNYKLTLPEGTFVTISFIGYVTQEITVGSQSRIDVQMEVDATRLEELVVVGYGTVQKKDLTGAVNSVKGEDLTKTPANTFVQSLQGRAAGVDIKAASNAPGGGIRIRIRGTNSINASSEPLYVIDGFPIDNINPTPSGAGNQAAPADGLSSISPSEIASIEILKDASATAIYGARGANGVVIITTKRGQEGKAKIDFNYSVNIANVRKRLDLANAEELAILNNEWAVNNNRPPIYDGVNKPLPSELGEGTDWQDQIFRTALTHTYNLSVSGGTENTQYLLSGNYLNQDGIIIESNFERAGIKFNLDQKVNNRVKVGFNLNANRSVNDAVASDGGGYQNDTPLWNALTQTPVNPVRDENGEFVHNHDETVKILENPVSIAETRTDMTTTNRILSNVFIDAEVLDGLTFRANFGADLINSKRNVYTPTTAETQGLPNLGFASIGAIQSSNWLAEYTLNYKREFNKNHRITALAGYTVQTRQTENVFARSDDFFTDKLQFNNLGVGADPRPSTSSATETGLLSYIGRLNYIFKDRYIFTGTVRRDGSSKFGDDNKWGVFPSAALAWRVSDESFMEGLGAFSELKLRASYGLTGNQNIGSYSSLALYNSAKPILGGVPVIGLVPNRIPNPDLKWEKTTQTNIGLDMELLEGVFSFSVDYYIKNTKDLLLNVAIPNQTGYGSSTQNIGEVENKGVELSLGLNHSFGELNWNSNINISFNRNKLVSLPEGTERLINGLGRGETAFGRSIGLPGNPLGLFYGYRKDGIWDSEEEIIAGGNSVGGKNRVGLAQYRDLNGDGFKDNDDDREIIGNPNPDFIYGFSNDFSYKGFSLSIFINGSYGNDLANLNRIGLLAQPQKHNVAQEYFDQRWTGPGTSTTIERPLTNAGEWKNFSDRDVLDGSYLRFKTINLSYNLPASNWFRTAQVYIAVDNLITITNYSGFDPEVDLYGSSNVQLGVDNGSYPASKSVRVGVKLGF